MPPYSPQVSVIIPTYGRPSLLMEAVTSVLDNYWPDFELLVIDQDPDKQLQAILSKKFNNDSRIKYLFLDYAGASRARNMGIKHSRGEIIAFVDDDLEVAPEWLSSYVNAFSEIKPTPGMIQGRVDPLWLFPRPEWFPEERDYLLGLYDKGNILMPMPEGDLPFTANCAITRKILYEVGLFDERLGFSYDRKISHLAGEDSLLSLKVKQTNCSIYYHPGARAEHKISSNKLTKKYFIKRNFWEGATTVAVRLLSQSDKISELPNLTRYHIREIRHLLWQTIFAKYKSHQNLCHAKERMRFAANCAYNLGVIYASTWLLRTKQLPLAN